MCVFSKVEVNPRFSTARLSAVLRHSCTPNFRAEKTGEADVEWLPAFSQHIKCSNL